jgi:hypothetical protein
MSLGWFSRFAPDVMYLGFQPETPNVQLECFSDTQANFIDLLLLPKIECAAKSK